MTTANPSLNPSERSNGTVKTDSERRRIPMSIPVRRLECPDLPGFHLHWFLEPNVNRALQAGYEFVEDTEIPLNQKSVGTSSSISGNQALGSHVEIIHGVGQDGKPSKLILMKIKEEWYREDQKVLADRNLQTVQAIFKQEALPQTPSGTDPSNRYVKTAILNRGLKKQS